THTGRLYGLNTIGAAVGAFLAGFYLLGLLGMWGTLVVAVLLNGGIGLVCLMVSRQKTRTAPAPAKQAERVSEPATSPTYRSAILYGSLAVFAVSGFCAMAYEVIWTKLLALIVGPTTYSFTIVLVTFILGLAVGAIIFGRLADRTGKPASLLAATQMAAGLSALIISHLLGNSQLFFTKLIATFETDFALLSLLKGVFLFLFMIVPTLCLGATFPTVGKIVTRSTAAVGRSIGGAYAINTIGAVAGSFCAGFLLVPALGKEGALSVVIGLQLLIALVFTGLVLRQEKKRLWAWAPAVAITLFGIMLCFHYPQWNRRLFAIGKYHRITLLGIKAGAYDWWESLLHSRKILEPLERADIVYYGDGVAGTTTVMKYVNAMGGEEYMMSNSGKPEASNRGDMQTQTMCAHFPMLFHPGAKTVMVLGLASGVTAGEILHYPIERLDVVEISSEVVRASNFFTPWNNNVLGDPRTNLIIQDGRAHLSLTDSKYDVVISEPSNPWMAGLATLFTRDFFSYVRDRLNDDGFFVQFMHSYQMDWPTFALVGRTFADVFPNSLLISSAPGAMGNDFFLIGIKGRDRISLRTALSNFEYAQRSSNVQLADPRLYYRLLTSEDLPKMFGTGPLNTDARPRLEFTAPKLMYQSGPDRRSMSARLVLSAESQRVLNEVESSMDAQIDFTAYALSVHMPFHAPMVTPVGLQNATPAQRQRYYDLIDKYCYDYPPLPAMFQDDSARQHCVVSQVESMFKKLDSLENPVRTLSYLTGLTHQQGMFDKEVEAYQRWLKIEPGSIEVRNNLAQTLSNMGRLDEAIEQFTLLVQQDPNNASIHFNVGLALARKGDLDSAATQFAEAIRLKPDLAEAHCKLGLCLVMKGRQAEAVPYLQEALRLKPDYPEARVVLQKALTPAGNQQK
ncbi:MAG TPA: fused MFS/spermidine synthase, partial [Candidatus Deferrimicrobium sp.]|nr:fused MFS/spermidine synthase [Candidatus Deferrimicrobium sp.]